MGSWKPHKIRLRDSESLFNNKGVIWMNDAKARPFFMLDGTLEYQKEIVDKIASGLLLESVAEYFERNGIEIPECQNDVEMKQRSNDFKKRYDL